MTHWHPWPCEYTLYGLFLSLLLNKLIATTNNPESPFSAFESGLAFTMAHPETFQTLRKLNFSVLSPQNTWHAYAMWNFLFFGDILDGFCASTWNIQFFDKFHLILWNLSKIFSPQSSLLPYFPYQSVDLYSACWFFGLFIFDCNLFAFSHLLPC